VVNADLGQVAGVVADGDLLPHVRGEGQVQIPQPVAADAVAVHDPRGGDGQQQQVQLLEGVRQPREPAACGPPLERCLRCLRVDAAVVGAGDEPAHRGVQGVQGQSRRSDRFPGRTVREVPGQGGQQLGRHRPEEPFDLPAALGNPGCGVDQLHPGVGAHLGDVAGGEVGAVVGVERGRQPAHRPLRVGLPPDRLPQRQRGLHRGRCPDEHGVPGHRPGAVVEHDGQPRPHRPAPLVHDQHVELGVVDLPALVRVGGLPAHHQLEPVPVGGGPPLRQRRHPRVHPRHDRPGRGVRRRRPPPLLGHHPDGTVQLGQLRRRAAQRHPLDQRDQLHREPSGTDIGPESPAPVRPARRSGTGRATAAPSGAAPPPRPPHGSGEPPDARGARAPRAAGPPRSPGNTAPPRPDYAR